MAVTKVEFWGRFEDEPDGSPVHRFNLSDHGNLLPGCPVRKVIASQSHELVIRQPSIRLLIDYPLQNPVTRLLNADTEAGFTRGGLIRAIRAAYEAIYAEEEVAVGDPGRGTVLYNRLESNGPYGIWGHYLHDLVVHGITKMGQVWHCNMSS